MQIYFKNCKKHTGNKFPKKLILISSNKIKGKWKCALCLTKNTFIHVIEDKCDLESELEVYIQFFIDWYYKNMKSYWTKNENLNSEIFKKKKVD